MDFNRLQLIIRHGKGDRYRVVNISNDCMVAIQRWLNVRPKPKEGHEKALFISSQKRRVSKFLIYNTVKRYASFAEITKPIYPHKFRITMITHMAENGCTVNEIQAQSGHKKTDILLEYVQHSSERIRKSYDRVFERDITTPEKPTTSIPAEHYKKEAFQKYLNGEIDVKILSDILNTMEDKQQEKKQEDIAYH